MLLLLLLVLLLSHHHALVLARRSRFHGDLGIVRDRRVINDIFIRAINSRRQSCLMRTHHLTGVHWILYPLQLGDVRLARE